MKWNAHFYVPPEKKLWHGRSDSPSESCFFQVVRLLDLNELRMDPAVKPRDDTLLPRDDTLLPRDDTLLPQLDTLLPQLDTLLPRDDKGNASKFALLGFCCDEGIKRNLGRTGAAQGPDVLRNALAKIPVPQRNMIFYDAGNVVCENEDLETAQSVLGDCVSLLLNHNITPIVIGGGHELAYGHYQGIEKHLIQNHKNKNLGIINFDAHFDMRPMLSENLGSSGTPFLQIVKSHEKTNRRFDYNCLGIQKTGNLVSLFETAKKYHAKTFLAEDVHQNEIAKSSAFLDRMINENDSIYMSLCLDVFSSAYAPGVSAPQPLGLTPWQVIPLVRHLAKSCKVTSYDIAELSPKYDTDQHTTKLAASFVYEIINSHTR